MTLNTGISAWSHHHAARAKKIVLSTVRIIGITWLGIFAIVVALAGSIFRPDMVRSAGYAALICAVLFFVIKSADSLIGAFRS